MRPNTTKLTPSLYVGGDLAPGHEEAQVAGLVELGITHVLDLRQEWSDSSHYIGSSITYQHEMWDDHGEMMPWEFWDLATDVAEMINDGEVVHVHCHMGVNRAPSLAVAALIRAYNWPPTYAYSYTVTARKVAWAIYAPQFMEKLGYIAAADWVNSYLEAHISEVRRTIGMIRRAEKTRHPWWDDV